MRKKIIITILGLIVLISIQMCVNIFILHGKSDYMDMLLLFWIIMYYVYFKLMVNKYLKL